MGVNLLKVVNKNIQPLQLLQLLFKVTILWTSCKSCSSRSTGRGRPRCTKRSRIGSRSRPCSIICSSRTSTCAIRCCRCPTSVKRSRGTV